MPQETDDSTDSQVQALEHACRGVVGDRLRSVSVDGPDHSGTLYRRSDLPARADAPVHEAMADGASCQSPVLTDGGRPSPPSAGADGGRTVCAFENGYVARIQVGDTSVVATTDGIKMDRDTELSAAVRGVLRE
ncbi:DUF7522 family protein [Halolamina salifodinae]|uniref:Uncharacterized protein n=1 Tax=Halolamina salifodinae TaxID=1202767 RepID=A0A8T4H1B6_9EURY|nr:hypothetical protein [Halolamina salifodinae]MBP1987118.1 hypothetical protein [Halolamina salifodinae]